MLDRLRRAVRLVTRRFDAAAGGRRWQGVQTFGPINAEIGAAAEPVRRRAAHVARNNPWAGAGVSALVSGLIGAGIKPRSTHRDPKVRAQLHEQFAAWTERADADGISDFYGQQALATRTMVEQGEVFAMLHATPSGLRVRLLDPPMVPLDDSRVIDSERHVIQGVEFDLAGSRIAYHVLRQRPELLGSIGYDKIRVLAQDMAHMFMPHGPGQVRGISWLTSVLLRLYEIDLYEDAQLVRQKVAAMFAGFLVDPNNSASSAFDGTTQNGILNSGLEPGTLKVLPSGFDVKFSDPAKIGDAQDFLKIELRAVAAGIGVPAYLLDGDLSQANYSSLRAALVEFRTRLEQIQYNVVVFQFCRPIWRAWVTTELLAGRLTGNLDDLLPCEWITPAQPWVDPQKDAAAEGEAIALGLKSRAQAVSERGWDIEELDRQIAADRARERALGLAFTPAATGGQVAPAVEPQP